MEENVMEESFAEESKLKAFLREKKKIILLIVLGILGVLGIFGGIGKSGESREIGDIRDTGKSREIGGEAEAEDKARKAPEVIFQRYENRAALPEVPSSVNSYTLKTNYTREEVLETGRKLGLLRYKEKGDNIVLYNTSDSEFAGLLIFNKPSGKFTYESLLGYKLGSGAESPMETAEAFLEGLGFADQSIECLITYRKADFPDTTFVECHRSWEAAGLPIFSFVGALNLGEDHALSDLRVGTESGNGRRPVDFNSATVAVGGDGRVVSVESNLRRIVSAERITPGDPLRVTPGVSFISAREALDRFISGGGEMALTLPVVRGRFDYNRVYPNNLAQAEKAVINDYVLVYLEKPEGLAQNKLEPYYLIRGTAELDSGYKVRFAEAVKAIKAKPFTNVKGVSFNQLAQAGLQLGSFTPVPTKELTRTPTPSPTKEPTPRLTRIPNTKTPRYIGDYGCNPSEDDLSPIYELGDLGRIGYWGRGDYEDRAIGFYYYIRSESQHLPELDEIISAFEALELGDGLARVRPLSILSEEWTEKIDCPLRFTGGSPTLFIYAEEEKKISVRVGREVVYSEPGVNNKGVWEIRAIGEIGEDKGLEVNGYETDYIYYEYESIEWRKEKGERRNDGRGWIVEDRKLEEFVRENLAKQMGLTELEEERLVFEFERAAEGITEPYLYVGIISEEEVNKKLPLRVNPEPELVVRRHFYLRGADDKSYKTYDGSYIPTLLSPIPRAEYMILELGAVSE